ncbi:hypothetical protein D3C80_1591310 [compost metagenome]
MTSTLGAPAPSGCTTRARTYRRPRPAEDISIDHKHALRCVTAPVGIVACSQQATQKFHPGVHRLVTRAPLARDGIHNTAQTAGATTLHQCPPPDVGQPSGDLEAVEYCLQCDEGCTSGGDAQHHRLRPVRQTGQPLGHLLDTGGHQVGGRADGIADAAHCVVNGLPCLGPHLRRGFPALGQVLVEDASGAL